VLFVVRGARGVVFVVAATGDVGYVAGVPGRAVAIGMGRGVVTVVVSGFAGDLESWHFEVDDGMG
jgi:hypothetical protein